MPVSPLLTIRRTLVAARSPIKRCTSRSIQSSSSQSVTSRVSQEQSLSMSGERSFTPVFSSSALRAASLSAPISLPMAYSATRERARDLLPASCKQSAAGASTDNAAAFRNCPTERSRMAGGNESLCCTTNPALLPSSAAARHSARNNFMEKEKETKKIVQRLSIESGTAKEFALDLAW